MHDAMNCGTIRRECVSAAVELVHALESGCGWCAANATNQNRVHWRRATRVLVVARMRRNRLCMYVPTEATTHYNSARTLALTPHTLIIGRDREQILAQSRWRGDSGEETNLDITRSNTHRAQSQV